MSRTEMYAKWWRRIIAEYELLLNRIDQEISRGTTPEELAALQTSRASVTQKLEDARRDLKRLLDNQSP